MEALPPFHGQEKGQCTFLSVLRMAQIDVLGPETASEQQLLGGQLRTSEKGLSFSVCKRR